MRRALLWFLSVTCISLLCVDRANKDNGTIDEVESLTAARAGAMSGTEPTDALRVGNFDANSSFREAQALSFQQVVNALLTQLDKLKQRRNVLVMSTSNLAQAIGEVGL